MLSRELADGDFSAEFPPPMERRGAGQDVVHVTMEVASQAKDGLIGYAAVEAVKRIVAAFKDRHPGVEADTESDESA